MPDNKTPYTTDDFDYELPPELIAMEPAKKRDASRLLVVSKSKNTLTDGVFSDISQHILPGDLLILNDTKVFPARLFGRKHSGGKIEILAEKILSENSVKVQIKSSRSPSVGSQIIIKGGIEATVTGRDDEFFMLRFESSLPALKIFERYGDVPLPPYINRPASEQDQHRYQTVYAQNTGAVAAPTAGLHFTEALIEDLQKKDVAIDYITLHVGAGTFKPLKVTNPAEHKMHSEYAHVSSSICERIANTKKNGGRVIAVGTTCVRALESAAYQRQFGEYAGETEIFIYPGFEFRVVDAMITNFHLPRSTLMMLISAFAGVDTIKSAYQHAINQCYRFYSYGDAMLLCK